ncbi:MAG: T9SS type A sorting domain-containing protein [Bacteroidota bacterium]
MNIKLIIFLLFFAFSTQAQIQEVVELKDIGSLNFDLRFKFNDRLFFGTRSPNNLWMTDGTATGTKKIEAGFEISNYYLIGDHCYITHANALYEINPVSYQLELIAFVSGGIKDVLPFQEGLIACSILSSSNTFIQKINPEDGATQLIFQVEGKIDEIVNFKDHILISYDNKLALNDGSMNGTTILFDGKTNSNRSINLAEGIMLEDQYIFSLHTDTYGTEPWVTDGTTAGTQLLKDIVVGDNGNNYAFGSFPSHFFKLDNTGYFVAFTEGLNLSLFRTDGTSTATELVFSLKTALDIHHINDVYAFKNEIYLEAVSTASGFELWKTDGTLKGTKIVKDIWQGSGSSASASRRRLNSFTEDYIYFEANDGIFGLELWRTDGTVKGTNIVSDFSSGADWSSTFPLAILDNDFYFIEGERNRGHRLYRLDQAAPLPEVPMYDTSYDWFQTIGYNFEWSNITYFLYNEKMEVDRSDNVYLIGEFANQHLQFYGSNDFLQMAPTDESWRRNFLVSYNDEGQFRWAKEIGGNAFAKEQAIAVDPEDHVICAGVYRKEGVLGDVPMTDSQNRFFLAKFTDEGQLLWHKQGNIGQGSKSEVNQIATDEAGNIYVGGCFTDFRAQFGKNQISAEVSPAFFVAKYDKNGNEQWLKHLPFPSVELHGFIKSLEVHEEKLYVIISDGDYNWSAPCDIRPFDKQIYVLNGDGEIINENRFVAGDLSFITDAKFSPSGYLYMIGMFRGNFEIGSDEIFTPCEDARGFVIKTDADLNVIETFVLETSNTFLQEIEFGADETYYLSGRQVLDSVPKYDFNLFRNYRNKSFVKKYDKFNRLVDERYFSKLHTDFDDSKPLISVDSQEKIILSERYRSSFDTLPASGGYGMKVSLIKFALAAQANYPKDEKLADDSVLLAPNPVQFELILSSLDEDFQEATFQIFDASGRWLASPSISYNLGITRIDVTNMAAGLYFLQIKTRTGQFTKKFIKVD